VGGLVEELLPDPDVRELHRAWVAAPRERVWRELQQVTLREMPVFRALLLLRTAPLRLTRRGRGPGGGTDRPLLAEMASAPFLPLAHRPPSELVLGLVARPWRLEAAQRRVDRPGFAAFAEPGWARVVLGFELRAEDGGTRITTETRVKATDGASRRRLRLYWLVVGPGSAATRRSLLRAVKRRAEVEEPD
jgi:hypothetical protein